MPLDPSSARKKAKALVAQAVDESVTPEEARSHAMRAAKIIAKYSLLDDPTEDLVGAVAGAEVAETVGAVVDLVSRFRKSGLGDALKRAAGSAKKAHAATRRRRDDR